MLQLHIHTHAHLLVMLIVDASGAWVPIGKCMYAHETQAVHSSWTDVNECVCFLMVMKRS